MSTGEFLFQIGEKHPERLHDYVPACGGGEIPFKNRNGAWVLYVWNVRGNFHGYMDVEGFVFQDLELTHLVCPCCVR